MEFLGTRQWVTVSCGTTRASTIVLLGAGALLVGLMVSLPGKRRRVWVRVGPGRGRAVA